MHGNLRKENNNVKKNELIFKNRILSNDLDKYLISFLRSLYLVNQAMSITRATTGQAYSFISVYGNT